jgi:hypothetical protein
MSVWRNDTLINWKSEYLEGEAVLPFPKSMERTKKVAENLGVILLAYFKTYQRYGLAQMYVDSSRLRK